MNRREKPMNRRDLLKYGASALVSIPFAPKFIPKSIWGVETPPWKKVMDLNNEELLAMTKTARTKGVATIWDFNKSLGDTIKEKYEDLYMHLGRVSTQVASKNGLVGCNWIVTSPEVASIFETLFNNYQPPKYEPNQFGTRYSGIINQRWKLYKNDLFPVAKILMGRHNESGYIVGDTQNLGHIEIWNFII